MKQVLLFFILLAPLFSHNQNQTLALESVVRKKPTVSFTFDDGKTTALGGYELEVWNEMILDALQAHQLKAILFVAGHNKRTKNGKYVLHSWDKAGHRIANHSLNHPNFNSDDVTLEQYKRELLLNDSIIRKYNNYMRCFRYPYLKEGNTPEKINGFRAFLNKHNYKQGHVTIDASDWCIDLRLRKFLDNNPNADVHAYKTFYINHIYERAMFYDSLAVALTGRQINHSLLLHDNLVSALFLNDLIKHFKAKGWEVMDADKAFNDEVYQTVTQINPAGESLIWAMAKQTGKYDEWLRYPGESDVYEKEKMDELGL